MIEQEARRILEALEQYPTVKAQFVRELSGTSFTASEGLIQQLFKVPAIRQYSAGHTSAEFVAVMKQVGDRLLAN